MIVTTCRAAVELMVVVGASPAVGACYPASEYPHAGPRKPVRLMTGRELLAESARRRALSPVEAAREEIADPSAIPSTLRRCSGALRSTTAGAVAYLLWTALDARAAALESIR